MAERICGETVTVRKGSGAGEVCVCTKDYRHVFAPFDDLEHWHLCGCSGCRFHTMWVDDQQIAEANAASTPGARDEENTG